MISVRKPSSLLPVAPILAVAAGAAACGDASTAVPPDGTARAEAEPGLSLSDLPPGALDTVAQGLDTPWEIRFLPDGDLLVTERHGRLLRLEGSAGGGVARVLEMHRIPEVAEVSEAGLMGLALHPGYPETPWIYACHTREGGGGLENRVVRFRHGDGALSGATVVVDGMAGSPVHDGCRLEFGPDGLLYVTMGDAGDRGRAQERGSPSGKVLRIAPDGSVPDGNPFGTRVWSVGHRNPQGLAFDDRDRLWSTEHGPSGFRSGHDELNLIRRAENYGWPEIVGDESGPGMRRPVIHSGGDTWAPAGLAVLDESLFFGGLRGSALYEVRLPRGPEGGTAAGEIGSSDVRLVAHFRGELGRIRPVRVGPDGWLWIGTSNRDGRGRVREGDDRIVRLDPAVFR